MNKLGYLHVILALAGMSVMACGSSSQPAAAAPQAADDLSDSAAVLEANDTDATLLALDERRRGRDRDDNDAGVDDAGVDDQGHGRRGHHAGPDRRGGRAGRGAGFERGLEALLAVADLAALEKCQDLQQGCDTGKDADACRAEVEACVRPILEDAFKALCEQRAETCKQDGSADSTCKRVEQACSEPTHAAKP